MNIIENIKKMVQISFDRVIEGEGIYSDFECVEPEISHVKIDNFIEGIPEKTIEKWQKNLRKKTLKDFLTDNPVDYEINDFGNFTWTNSDVEQWQMQFFSNKIVKLYEKGTLTQKRYEYTVSTATIWTSFDCGKVVATNIEEAREKAKAEFKEKFNKLNASLAMNEHTKDMRMEYDGSQIQITEKS